MEGCILAIDKVADGSFLSTAVVSFGSEFESLMVEYGGAAAEDK